MNLRKQLAILFRRLGKGEFEMSQDKTVTIKGICCDFEIPNDAPCPCACHTDDPEEWRERCKAYDAEWETSK